MKIKHFGIIITNFSGILILTGLLAAPFYFATQVSKPANIAGAKISRPYILISQIDKFPGLQLSQEGENYKVTFSKIAQSQAFTGIVEVTNPTGKSQNYELVTKNSDTKVFFGDDINNPLTALSVPSSAVVPISILSKENSTSPQTVEFSIKIN